MLKAATDIDFALISVVDSQVPNDAHVRELQHDALDRNAIPGLVGFAEATRA